MVKKLRSSRERLDRGHRSPSIYSRTEKIDERGGRSWLPVLLLLIFLSVLVYVIFFSKIFEIKNITINEMKYVNKEQVEKLTRDYKSSIIINNNLLTFFTPPLKKKINTLDGVKSVVISKNFPNGLLIKIEEKIPALSWQTLGNKYLVDNNGILFANFDEKFKDIPSIIDTKNVPVQIGKEVVSPDFCTFVNDVSKDFETQTGAKIARIEIPEITAEIKVVSSVGWYVLFDTTRIAKGEMNSLSRVISEAKAKKRKLEYVDLRIDNKIFYK